MVKYIAFLRGINVGGHKLIKMEDLNRMFVSLGFENVMTYIQSGNVIFEDAETNARVLTEKIERGLCEPLGYEVRVLLRTAQEIEDIVRRNPFKEVARDTNAKMYVTFLAEEPTSKLELPIKSPEKGFEILGVSNREVYSLAFPLPNGRNGDSVTPIEKAFGKVSTTRNWTTVTKIIR
jgi:uncharacterized protein (DUF1697 family)